MCENQIEVHTKLNEVDPLMTFTNKVFNYRLK